MFIQIKKDDFKNVDELQQFLFELAWLIPTKNLDDYGIENDCILDEALYNLANNFFKNNLKNNKPKLFNNKIEFVI